jgi:hypothetical protein
MDESYALTVGPKASAAEKTADLNATITANTFFGLRNGLETLSQLFVYDEIRDHLLVRIFYDLKYLSLFDNQIKQLYLSK